MAKIDYKKQLEHLYSSPKKKVVVVDVPKMNFLTPGPNAMVLIFSIPWSSECSAIVGKFGIISAWNERREVSRSLLTPCAVAHTFRLGVVLCQLVKQRRK